MNKIIAVLRKPKFEEKAKKLGVKLGQNVKIIDTVDWGTEPYLISVGDNTVISFDVTFVNHDGGINVLRNLLDDQTLDLIAPISIGRNCFIGAGSTILYGTVIEDNVIVGAGSIVKGNLKSGYVYAGVPAKQICSVMDFYEKHKSEVVHTKLMSQKEKSEYLKKLFERDK